MHARIQRALMVAALALGAGAGAAPASADDTIVATVTRSTTVDAYQGRALWSAWDPAVRAYRLTEYAGGRVRTLPVAPNAVPFDVDLGPDARGRTLAVYSRCARPPVSSRALGGRRGCDLHAYSFAGDREFRISSANSGADEYWPTVSGSRIAFTRTYTPRDGRSRRLLYWRSFHSGRPSRRLDRGPTNRGDAVPQQLDLNSRRLAFVWDYEYGAEVRLDTTTGHERRLVRVPGSGAAANHLDAQGPTIVGGDVHWALSVGYDAPVYSEIRRHELATGDDDRATMRIETDPQLRRATEGFAQDGDASWYVRAAARDVYEVHMATGLSYEPAPPIKLE